MMTNEQKLEQKVEEAVAEYLRGSEQIATTAVQRAFRGARGHQPQTGVARGKRRARSNGYARRSPEDLAALAEKLNDAVRAHPGETMKMLSSHIGESPRTLQVVVARLKRNDRIRTVGRRQFTRYFPMTTTLSSN